MNLSSRITQDLDKACLVLQQGGIVGIPTETVYGLAAVALNAEAVSRVFQAKGRPTSHPLIIHLSPHDDINRWGVLNESAQALANALWPGPLTLLVPRTRLVPDWVTGARDTVALRIPAHDMTLALLDAVSDAVVAPSANRFGHVSPTSAEHVINDLGDSVDLVLDGGSCAIGIESTIVECTNSILCAEKERGRDLSDLLMRQRNELFAVLRYNLAERIAAGYRCSQNKLFAD